MPRSTPSSDSATRDRGSASPCFAISWLPNTARFSPSTSNSPRPPNTSPPPPPNNPATIPIFSRARTLSQVPGGLSYAQFACPQEGKGWVRSSPLLRRPGLQFILRVEGFILRIQGPRRKPPQNNSSPNPFLRLTHAPVISTGMNDSFHFSLRSWPSARSSTVILGRQKF